MTKINWKITRANCVNFSLAPYLSSSQDAPIKPLNGLQSSASCQSWDWAIPGHSSWLYCQAWPHSISSSLRTFSLRTPSHPLLCRICRKWRPEYFCFIFHHITTFDVCWHLPTERDTWLSSSPVRHTPPICSYTSLYGSLFRSPFLENRTSYQISPIITPTIIIKHPFSQNHSWPVFSASALKIVVYQFWWLNYFNVPITWFIELSPAQF